MYNSKYMIVNSAFLPLLQLITNTNVGGYFKMNIFSKIFGKTKTASKSLNDINDFEKISIEDFSKLSKDDRIIAIMELGDRKQVDLNQYQIFQFAILIIFIDFITKFSL